MTRRASQKRRRDKNQQTKKYTLTYAAKTQSKRTKERRGTQGVIPMIINDKGITSSTFGHTVASIDNRSTFRVVFQNPNGIDPSEGNYSFLLSLSECYNQCVSLIGWAETNRE